MDFHPNLSEFCSFFKNLFEDNVRLNSEGKEYNACTFNLNERTVVYRTSKVTPSKTGQFVTIWKRNEDGQTAPFDISDNLGFIVIESKGDTERGLFIFPQSVLLEQGVISQIGQAGKRGMRVYPPWDTTMSNQAKKSQTWQTNYFLRVGSDDSCDVDLAKKLFDNSEKPQD